MGFPRHELQSGETDEILNTIDGLRQLGLGSILELPQIIVCGDQSSGKSSVLNAVSTLQFPTKDGLCTRFATEVIMRPANEERIEASIVPGSGRSPDERRTLDAFRIANAGMDEIESVIERATGTMGIDPRDPHARRFSDDILRFVVTGPDQPSLTLVDLPGLFRAESRYQTKEDMVSVRELVRRYMGNKRSVILAVISAKSDFVLQSVTDLSGEVDPKGRRTLGIITKPDKLDVGSDSEKMFLELTENKLKFLHRGWHVVVNRDHATSSNSQEQRDNHEKRFLSQGAWARVPANHKGVFSLRERLSMVLREHILEELPNLIQEADAEVLRCEATLAELGAWRASAKDRRGYLMRAAQEFSVIIRSSINGSYEDKFFLTNDKDTYRPKRLRAVVQDLLLQYSEEMHLRGHAKHIVDDAPQAAASGHPCEIKQTEFEDRVMDLIKHSRGRELTITHNPMIVRDLFREQSEPWVDLTRDYRTRLVAATRACIDLVLLHTTDENTKAQLEMRVITPSLARLVSSLDRMVERLMKPRLEGHPITYARRLAQHIATAKQKRSEKQFADMYNRLCAKGANVVNKDTLRSLFAGQSVTIWPIDLPRFAASEAVIEMRAYYKIARETLVDNFSQLAVEDCLISQIPNLFSPEVVASMGEDMISEMAEETGSAACERAQTEERLERCRSAWESLVRMESMRVPGTNERRNASGMQQRLTPVTARRVPDVRGPSSGLESGNTDKAQSVDEQVDMSVSRLDSGFSEREEEQSFADRSL